MKSHRDRLQITDIGKELEKMGIYRNFVSQTRKPEGALGKMMLNGMNSGHAKMADWGLSHLPDMSPAEITDLGCGGGRNAGELLRKYPNAKVTAVDYSALSVEKAKEYNKNEIASGRCTVMQGDVSDLKLPAGKYDLATAFETVYFWPGLEKCFAQVCRVLKPGGWFMICNESDGTDSVSLKYEKIIEGMKCHTAEELERALTAAGFTDIQKVHHPDKPWIAVLARKA